MKEYYDSFLEELEQISVVERNMLQNADISFHEGKVLCLKLEDSIVAKGKKEALCSYLEHVYGERFGCPVEVHVLYEEKKESLLKHNEEKLRQEVEAILEQTAAVQEEKEKAKEKEGRNRTRSRRAPLLPAAGIAGKETGDMARKRMDPDQNGRAMILILFTEDPLMMSLWNYPK